MNLPTNPDPGDCHVAEASGGLDAADQAAAELRAFVETRPVPDVASSVLAAIAREGLRPDSADRARWRRLVAWFWAPRAIVFRPAYGLVPIVAALLWAWLAPASVPVPAVGSSPAQQADAASQVGIETAAPTGSRVFVQFRLLQADATDVRLAGSFNEWRPTLALRQTSPGVWTGTVALAPGVYDYLFVVDGRQWVSDPYAPSVSDGFGGINSRLALMLPEGAS